MIVDKQHKYESGITFSFIIVMTPKCQPGHDLHHINNIMIQNKKESSSEAKFKYYFSSGFYFYWHFMKKWRGE